MVRRTYHRTPHHIPWYSRRVAWYHPRRRIMVSWEQIPLPRTVDATSTSNTVVYSDVPYGTQDLEFDESRMEELVARGVPTHNILLNWNTLYLLLADVGPLPKGSTVRLAGNHSQGNLSVYIRDKDHYHELKKIAFTAPRTSDHMAFVRYQYPIRVLEDEEDSPVVHMEDAARVAVCALARASHALLSHIRGVLCAVCLLRVVVPCVV